MLSNHPSSHYQPPSPPPLSELPPPPQGLPVYSFRGSESKTNGSHQRPIHEHSFSFTNRNSAPRYPRERDAYRPKRMKQNAFQNRGIDSLQEHRPLRHLRRDKDFVRRPQRDILKPRIATAQRPLLRLDQGNIPQQMLGHAADPKATKRFLSVDDMSDSSEEQMEESVSDQTESEIDKSHLKDTQQNGMLEVDYQTNVEPPSKRQALTLTNNESDVEVNIPRWSNPDPYTILPPLNDVSRKRKNVVKLIRKARIVADDRAKSNSTAAGDDFISFGLDDETNHYIRSPTSQSAEELIGGETSIIPGLGYDSRILSSKTDSMISTVTALGFRKRTHDDIADYSQERPSKRRKGISQTPNGFLMEDWVPRPKVNPTPWLDKQPQISTENMGFRLHKEICDFYDFVRPQHFEQFVREDLLDRLRKVIKASFSNCALHCFGSFAAGLYLPNSDMDVVVVSREFESFGTKIICQTNSRMYKFGSYLQQAGIAEQDSVEVITHAKVPLIKFVDRITAIKIDMSFENLTGLVAINAFDHWKTRFPAMPIIVTVIKQFLLMRGLNEVANGGLGGFSVTCLVTSLLQNMPRVQNEDFEPERHLGEILMEFLDFYGNQLDISRTGIMMNPPSFFDKSDYARQKSFRHANNGNQLRKADRLAIIDPNDSNNDISGGSRNIMLVFDKFSEAHSEISKALKHRNRKSLLNWMLGGDYATFLWQRSHLRNLYKKTWGSPTADFV